jgi:amino acid transporter
MHSSALIADYMQSLSGNAYAKLADVLILVASFASVFAVLLGFSRIPFAAARDGEFFSIFARIHPTKGFPNASLIILGVLSAFACLLSLSTLISLVIVIQTMVQFLAQCVAVVLFRRSDAGKRKPTFRMPFYPIPVAVAFLGWLLILVSSGTRNILVALAAIFVGMTAFLFKTYRLQKWPFQLS